MNSMKFENNSTSCNCVGPRNNEPVCPCEMKFRKIYQKNGRWVEPEKDLGPVYPSSNSEVDFYEKIRGRRDNMSSIGGLDYEI